MGSTAEEWPQGPVPRSGDSTPEFLPSVGLSTTPPPASALRGPSVLATGRSLQCWGWEGGPQPRG